MAFNPVYEHDSSKMVKLDVNGSIFYLADEDLRGIVNTFGDAVFKDVADQVVKGNVNLVTSNDVATAIEEAVKDLEGAMHFRGVIVKEDGESDLDAITRIVTDPKAGDIVIIKGNGKEYIYNGALWEEVGDQNVYLTKSEAERDYVKQTTSIAGKALNHNITVEEISGSDALNLKSLSHKDSASGTVSTIDSGTVAAGKPGTYNVTAQTVTVPKTYDALDVTPAGTVAVSKQSGAVVTYDKTNSITMSGVTASSEQTPNYTPSGAVSVPNIDASLDLQEAPVATVTDSGTGYSLSDGDVVKGEDTKSAFLVKGYRIEVDTTDPTQLNIHPLTAADTTFFGNAVTASGDVTYTKQELTGSLPTFGSKNVVVKSGSTVAAALASAPVFTGAGAVLSAQPNYSSVEAGVTDAVFTADFAGEGKSVIPTVATTENAEVTSATVTVPEETYNLSFERTGKTVTVS